MLNGGVASTTDGTVQYSFELGLAGGDLQPVRGRFLTLEAGGTESVSEPVEGLEPGRTYEYRVCADFCSRTREFTTDEPLGQDYAIGWFPANGVLFIVDVRSEPGGANPLGEVTADQGRLGKLTGEVACLSVDGSSATIGVTFPQGVGSGFFFLKDDPDGFGSAPLMAGQDVSDCSPDPPSPPVPIASGSITVHDE